MHFTKKIGLSWLMMLLICLNLTALAATPETYSASAPSSLEKGHLYGESCILIDATTGRILFEKNAYERRYPASTTKIMTCILAIEHGPMGQMITIPAGVEVSSDSSKLGIVTGEVMLFDDLLYGMMISSGNDAAIALAILVSGSESEFVKLMNRKAQELGMTGTHYENAHGYHKVNHYTTAYDLALVTQYAMKNATFRDVVKQVDYIVSPTNIHPNGISVTTKYDLLIPDKDLYYEYCVGVKTGSTNAAGRCFVGAAVRDDINLISVTLNTDPDDKLYVQAFTDTIRLFNYGFELYTSMSFYDICDMCEDQYLSFEVENAAKNDPGNGYLKLSIVDIPQDYREWFLKTDLEDVNYQRQMAEDFTHRITVTFNENALKAPISAGDVLGSALYFTPTGDILSGAAAASRDVEMEPPTMDEVMDQWIEDNAPFLFKLMPRHNPPVRILYWAIVAGVVVLIALRIRKVRKRNRIRKQILERKRKEYIKRQKQREAYLKAHPEMRNVRSKAPSGAQGKPRPAPGAHTRAAAPARPSASVPRPAVKRPAGTAAAPAARTPSRPKAPTSANKK